MATPQTIENIIANPANGRHQPLADFVKTALTSDTLVSISQAAKILKLPFGRNTIFRKLRESGIFFKSKNEPKQKFCDADYFRVVERSPIETSDGLLHPKRPGIRQPQIRQGSERCPAACQNRIKNSGQPIEFGCPFALEGVLAVVLEGALASG